MASPFPFTAGLVVAVAALSMATGCSSTSANPGAADADAQTTDSQGEAGPDDTGSAACASDASVQLIQASNYDQSCTADTDCRLIATGNACVPCAFNCPFGGAINVSALAKYNSDIANTPAVASGFNGQTCASGCGAAFGPCCVGGKCQTSTTDQCPGPVDAGQDAAGDAGPADANGE
jgi:hypothetical protein